MEEQAILVTGAGRRIGFHLAKRLHERGYKIIAHYRSDTDEVKQLAALGIITIQADLSSTQAILSFVEQLKASASDYRALIHNASSFEPTSEDLYEAAEQYDRFYTVHMKAPFLINQALLPLMTSQDNHPADIIHITDINVENPTPRFDVYGTTKAGLHNMMLVLAKKYAPKIKVNAVAPGPVLFTDQHSEDVKQAMLSETLLGKEGGAEPVYLAVQSILDNPFMTGVSLAVDGGRRLSKR